MGSMFGDTSLTVEEVEKLKALVDAGLIGTDEIANGAVTQVKISASSGYGLGLLRVARAKYDFAGDGGAIGTITPPTARNATIPDNAIIVGGTINSIEAVTSLGAATVSIGTSAGSSATSILGVTGKASFSLDALINAVPVFAAPLKMTAAGSITFTIGTADLTAGVIEVTLLYFVAGA